MAVGVAGRSNNIWVSKNRLPGYVISMSAFDNQQSTTDCYTYIRIHTQNLIGSCLPVDGFSESLVDTLAGCTTKSENDSISLEEGRTREVTNAVQRQHEITKKPVLFCLFFLVLVSPSSAWASEMAGGVSHIYLTEPPD